MIPHIVSSKDTYSVGQVLRLGPGRYATVIAKKQLVDGWGYYTTESSMLDKLLPKAPRLDRLRNWFQRHREKLVLLWKAAKFIYGAAK